MPGDSTPVPAGQPTARRPVNYYYNVSQLRYDTWQNAKAHSASIAAIAARGGDVTRQREQLREELLTLKGIEDYTAFPSKDDFRFLWRLFEAGDHVGLARVIGKLVRALVGQTYRRRHIDLTEDELDDEAGDEIEMLRDPRDLGQTVRPYFEVLVVDQLTPQEEGAIRSGFRRVRRTEDRFVYDTVVVPSFEDALIAVLFNHNI